VDLGLGCGNPTAIGARSGIEAETSPLSTISIRKTGVNDPGQTPARPRVISVRRESGVAFSGWRALERRRFVVESFTVEVTAG
jgi:hypothetical protein